MVKHRLIIFVILTIFGMTNITVNPSYAQEQPGYDPTVCASDNVGTALSKACLAMIDEYPRPEVDKIEPDNYTLNVYSFWRVGPEAVNTYDVPNGNLIGQIPRGFNFVNAVDLTVDGWLKTQDGRWIKRGDAKPTKPSYFSGVELSDGLKYPFAWVLDKSGIYASEYPGGPASAKTKRVLVRYELVNLFATVIDAQGWRWYMIGPNQWVKQAFLATVHRIERPEGVRGRWVAIDLYEQTLLAYEDDTPVFATVVATGLPPNETNEGVFKVWARMERDAMSGATGAPNAYALQRVPWVMYFDKSISLHGTYWHDLFGYRQSRGCVNLSISDAHYLYKWMAVNPGRSSEAINYVYVYSSGKYGKGTLRQ